jgi:hypothetical protein
MKYLSERRHFLLKYLYSASFFLHMKYFIINTPASRRRFEPFPYSPDALPIELSRVQDSVEVLRAGNGPMFG